MCVGGGVVGSLGNQQPLLWKPQDQEGKGEGRGGRGLFAAASAAFALTEHTLNLSSNVYGRRNEEC